MRTKKLFRWWTVSLSLLLMMSYGIAFISPAKFWPAYFFSLSVPILFGIVVVNILLLIILKEKSLIFISLVSMILTSTVFSKTYQFGSSNEKKEPGHLEVMSYNVHVFNLYENLHKKSKASSIEIIKWVKECPSDILCLQEYYNEPNGDIYNVKSQLKEKGYHFFHELVTYDNKVGSNFGLAIYSKLKILNAGNLNFSTLTNQNRGHFVDIINIDDTIRVLNIHLESFYKRKSILSQKGLKESKIRALKYLIETMRIRAIQAENIDSVVKSSPYKVILCGDFNALPYEYPYKKIGSTLYNAFEEKGEGFGFTRYGSPFPVRIDHQFFSDGLTIKSFKTLNNLRYSDHVPLIGVYSCD